MQTAIIKAIKYALATFFAIFIAQWLGLEYAVTAGIIAILSLAETNRATVLYIEQIAITMLLSLGTAWLLFPLLDYNIWVFSLYLLIAYPLAVLFKSQRAIAPCAVSVSHLLIEETVAFDWLLNEFLLLIIGTVLALLVNLYQPSKNKIILAKQAEVENLIRQILNEFSDQLANGDNFYENSGRLDDLTLMIRQAINLAEEEEANRLSKTSFYYREYFEMRNQQTRILYEIDASLHEVGAAIPQHQALADFMQATSQQLHESNTGRQLKADLRKIRDYYSQSPLPKSRQEFEERAILFEILQDCQKFLDIKASFYRHVQSMDRHFSNRD
ncbi:aromatic acid exporter family protein [Aerococcus kribbianus]|uniref:Aromatic acid exporter family protein n=1 Tax=Aerococcus kribbianus TaxID=2999064 RepID=A0A9X3FTR7_9LACT|nr:MULTISPECIES: aromatic acid exporter family protein [unclassified Aerococcus]MCZ0716711.1 aromatic acid exporter family protein [Aerococcus sp. YH-aer221]MCZ0724999.1 aromatic acid exporter family protein [Aerococcus sp. YH-aer222]